MVEPSPNSFLLELTFRLAGGLIDLDPKRAARHAGFLWGLQQPDGGFAGRMGGSDIYYTSFAVRGLALLDTLDGPRTSDLAVYLRSGVVRKNYTLVDLVSWFYSAITLQMAAAIMPFEGDPEALAGEVSTVLETFRRPDGGYAKTHEGGAGSTYNTFMAVLCYELLGRTPPDTDGIVRFVLSRRRDDGGFVEIGPMKRSGTNPTAAAAVLLRRFDAIDDAVLAGIGDYLQKVHGPEGGIRANTQIPFCDLLSTFTGLLIASDLDLVGRIDTAACRRFVESLEQPEGGFHGAVWDVEADAEYTFYGLGCLALLRPTLS